MKAYFIITVFSLLLCSCSNSKLGSNGNIKDRNKFLKPYVDSVNNFTEGSRVPNFLFNPCFDNNPWYWNGMHEPISLRELVIKKVKNKEALNYFIANYATELSVKCSKQVDSAGIYVIRIPNIDKSFYDLLTHRLEELK